MTVLPTVRGQLLAAAERQTTPARRGSRRAWLPRPGTVVAAFSVAVTMAVAAVAVVLLHGARATHSVRPPAHRSTSLLARPLHFPSLGPGGRCPTSSGRPVDNRFFAGTALGDGPVRVLVAQRGDLRHGRVDISGVRRGSMYAIQTLWYAMPGYDGPFVVRGARLGKPGSIEVQPGGTGERAGTGPLVVPAGATLNTYYTRWRHGHSRDPVTGRPVPTLIGSGYRTVPGSTWITSPGCYAWQVDGRGFSEVIVFDAIKQPPHAR